MASELAVPVPHGPSSPRARSSRHVDELIAFEATESDRSRPPQSPARPENGTAATFAPRRSELLPHSMATHQRAAAGGTDVADWLHAATVALVAEIPVERL